MDERGYRRVGILEGDKAGQIVTISARYLTPVQATNQPFVRADKVSEPVRTPAEKAELARQDKLEQDRLARQLQIDQGHAASRKQRQDRQDQRLLEQKQRNEARRKYVEWVRRHPVEFSQARTREFGQLQQYERELRSKGVPENMIQSRVQQLRGLLQAELAQKIQKAIDLEEKQKQH